MLEFFCGRSLGVVVEVAHETLPGSVPAESRSKGKSNRTSESTNEDTEESRRDGYSILRAGIWTVRLRRGNQDETGEKMGNIVDE